MTDELCGSTDTSSGDPCKWNEVEKGTCPFHNGEDTDVGRPSKLTKERQESIAQQIEKGKSVESASRMNGISPATFYNWMDRGEGEENTIYAEFFERVTRAYGFGENKYFNVIWDMAKEENDIRILVSMMKQRYPDSWGETETGVDADETVIKIPENVAKEWQRQ